MYTSYSMFRNHAHDDPIKSKHVKVKVKVKQPHSRPGQALRVSRG
jgi:hypothetical protein